MDELSPGETSKMKPSEYTNIDVQDLYASARWLKPSSRIAKEVYQAPGPEECATRWEVFRNLPKPASWAEAEKIAQEPPAPVEWDGVQAPAVLNFDDLVSRSYEPDYEHQPQPLRTWDKGFISHTQVESTGAPAFEYVPLCNGDEIRILELQPGEGLDPLGFKLRPVSLSASDIEYEALSYAWGDTMVEILHENKLVSFPENLFRALLRLRHPTQTRALWADALCINQGEEREKSCQVRMMRNIFKKASRVLIWLGDDDAHVAQPAFDLARRFREDQARTAPPPESPVWGVFIRLFKRDWFGRLWCLQEVVLAQSADVIWGPATAPWEDIGFTAGWICNVGYEVLATWMSTIDSRRAESRSGYHPGIYRASLMYSLWSAGKDNFAEPMSFYSLMCLTRPFKTTDLRDKVFALIGIPTLEADPDLGQCFFEPDYSKSVEDVFVEVAKRFMTQKPGSLDFLGAVQHEVIKDFNATEYELPSWVPNWDNFRSRSLVPVMTPGDRRISASSNVPPAEFTFDQLTLLVSGVHIDVVKDEEYLASRGHFESMVYFLAKAWEKHVQPLETYRGGISLPEAFCWTITGGKNCYGRRLSGTDRVQHIADYEAFRKKYCVREDRNFPEIKGLDETETQEGGDAHRFYEALCHACSNRSFFVTEKGYIGIGPDSMFRGDMVSVLSGTELPFVLRKYDPEFKGLMVTGIEPVVTPDTGEKAIDMFEVVGECYMHSIMDGEVDYNSPGIDTTLIRFI